MIVPMSAGARTDLQNCKKRTAADFARTLSIPSYLQMGLDGDPSECQRVSSLALADCYLEM